MICLICMPKALAYISGKPLRAHVTTIKCIVYSTLNYVFVGFEADSDLDNKVYTSAVLKVKEGSWIGTYSKRFCVLCCTKLYVYKMSTGGSPQSKPSYSLTLSEITTTKHSSSKHHYCVRLRSVMDKEPEIVLAFSSLLQQSKWINRLKKVASLLYMSIIK